VLHLQNPEHAVGNATGTAAYGKLIPPPAPAVPAMPTVCTCLPRPPPWAWRAWHLCLWHGPSDSAPCGAPAAAAGEDARVRVRFVDFAHTFKLDKGRQQRDHNFLAGLRAIIARLSAVMRAEAMDSLT
jgi:hypothetical protein